MAKGLRTASELEQRIWVDVNERHPGVVPSTMTIKVSRKGETWEALPDSHSVIVYADACHAIGASAMRIREQYDLMD